jgi:hypothetical protein
LRWNGKQLLDYGLPAVIEPQVSQLYFFLFGNLMGILSCVSCRKSAYNSTGMIDRTYPYAGDFFMLGAALVSTSHSDLQVGYHYDQEARSYSRCLVNSKRRIVSGVVCCHLRHPLTHQSPRALGSMASGGFRHADLRLSLEIQRDQEGLTRRSQAPTSLGSSNSLKFLWLESIARVSPFPPVR